MDWNVDSWLQDLNGVVTQVGQIKTQIEGPAKPTSPVTVPTQAGSFGGLSTGMIAVGVVGLIVLAIIVKKVL